MQQHPKSVSQDSTSTLGPCSRMTRAGHLVPCVHTQSSLPAPASCPGHLGWSLTGRGRSSTTSCDLTLQGPSEDVWGQATHKTTEMAPGELLGSKVGAVRANRDWGRWWCSLLLLSTLGHSWDLPCNQDARPTPSYISPSGPERCPHPSAAQTLLTHPRKAQPIRHGAVQNSGSAVTWEKASKGQCPPESKCSLHVRQDRVNTV